MLANRMLMSPIRYSTTKLLLHMNGSNGSTVFTDSSVITKLVTANGNSQISTAQYKFGGASGFFDGSGDYLSIPTSSDFIFNIPWCFDCWFRPARLSNATYSQFIFRKGDNTQGISLHFDDQSGTRLRFSYGSGSELTFACTLVLNTWYHVEVSYDGSKLYCFLDGTLLNTGGTSWTPPSNNSLDFFIGKGVVSQQDYSGYIDELRWVSGVAGHTSNFTPPTSEYTP
ncbi:MAG: LamG domain-containing protein [Clostridia bacterium]|nr:LamG domain-containing protein [Clostridia bacterium]